MATKMHFSLFLYAVWKNPISIIVVHQLMSRHFNVIRRRFSILFGMFTRYSVSCWLLFVIFHRCVRVNRKCDWKIISSPIGANSKEQRLTTICAALQQQKMLHQPQKSTPNDWCDAKQPTKQKWREKRKNGCRNICKLFGTGMHWVFPINAINYTNYFARHVTMWYDNVR